MVAALLTCELVAARGRLAQDFEVLRDAGRSNAAVVVDRPELPALPSPAPASAGPVVSVGVRALRPCLPGQPCVLRIQVLLHPAPFARSVQWVYRAVDRCTGAVTDLPGGAVEASAFADRLDVVQTVPLPRAQVLGVHGLTSGPAAAASQEPMSAPVHGRCPPAVPARAGDLGGMGG